MIKGVIVNALKELIEKDGYLLKNSINERTITHKLAKYLEQYYPKYSVDCEYNGMVNINGENIPKRIHINSSETIRIDNGGEKTVFPDIIVHKRGGNDENLIVIEAKKTNNLNENDVRFDKDKLKAYKDEFGYSNAFFIKIPVGNDLNELKNIDEYIEEIK